MHVMHPALEDMCLTVIMRCGPPPPIPNGTTEFDHPLRYSALGAEGLKVRTAWLDDVAEFVSERYKVNSYELGEFIQTIDYWWESQETAMH